MRILQLCPLWFPIKLDAPGGIETLLYQLVPALENLGCEVTLLASGDSEVSRLVPVVPTNLYEHMRNGAATEYACYEQHQLQLALDLAPEFDLVHSHLGVGAFCLSRMPGVCALHTIHTPVYPDLQWFASRHRELCYSTVSEFQARALRSQGATRCQAIHNGIDMSRFSLGERGGEGLVFLGRIERVKGPDLAVQTARSLGLPLVMGGPIVEEDFFASEIRPYLDDRIRYIGVADHAQKTELLRRADCALLPFRGAEPFGLVVVEAMACGTPVVSLANGALPEIVEVGSTGYLAKDETDLAPLVPAAMKLDRAAIRRSAEARFDVSSVAPRYLELYAELAGARG